MSFGINEISYFYIPLILDILFKRVRVSSEWPNLVEIFVDILYDNF